VPEVERGWKRVDVYEDDDLENTILDCKRCHQPGGLGTRKILRMHEHTDPWTHFLRADRPGGRVLLDDFHLAHGTGEDYGPIPAALIERSAPSRLEALVVNNGFGDQPNPFDSARIEQEVEAGNPSEPEVNVPLGRSETWQRLFDNAILGLAIPPPYHDAKVYDSNKLAAAAAMYGRTIAGAMPASLMPDLRDVFLDDALVDLGVRPPRGASGRAILVQMCQDCHNSAVDPTISRARFDVARLDQMSREEKDLAIARLGLEPTSRLRMPPPLFRALSSDEIARVTVELEK
jgi:hypothetical protein